MNTSNQLTSDYLKSVIRTVPNWPKPGVNFRDITPLMLNKLAFRRLIDAFVHQYQEAQIDAIAAIDARGFIIGAPLAYELNTSFVPVRKQGKLPFRTFSETYTLEYGEATVELHADAVLPGQRILIIDDLVATGGSMLAATNLVRRVGGEVLACASIIELSDLGGGDAVRAAGYDMFSVCQFTGIE